jgi:glycosyltransferase involved in cell wall biosynthesis
MPKVSFVIPCYNHGKYIDEAIASIEQIGNPDLYEIIIVNDGSPDEYTNTRLKELATEGYRVVFQKNSGVCTTRNNAIALSTGTYILPLDADNKIRAEFVLNAIKILDNEPDIDIVYGDGLTFGEKEEPYFQGEYNLQKLMITNFIDTCALYRREVWEKTGGYDANVPSFEDWEIWLHASFLGFRFRYLNEIAFDYRILPNSLIRQTNRNKTRVNQFIEYISQKHAAYFGPQFIHENIVKKTKKSPAGFLGKLILMSYFPKLFLSLVKKGYLRKYV